MLAVVKPIAGAWATTDVWASLTRLFALVAHGAVVYFLDILLLWTMSGRPDRTEAALLRRAAPMLGHLQPDWRI